MRVFCAVNRLSVLSEAPVNVETSIKERRGWCEGSSVGKEKERRLWGR